MVIVHLLSILLGLLTSPDLINFVESLGLSELIDLTADKAGKELLGEAVVNGFAYRK